MALMIQNPENPNEILYHIPYTDLEKDGVLPELTYDSTLMDLWRRNIRDFAKKQKLPTAHKILRIEAVPDKDCLVIHAEFVDQAMEADLRFCRLSPRVWHTHARGLANSGNAERQAGAAAFDVPQLVSFAFLDELTEAVGRLPDLPYPPSSLYQVEGQEGYLLVFVRGSLSAEDLLHFFSLFSEISGKTPAPSLSLAYLKEHGRCLIPKNALEKLKKAQ